MTGVQTCALPISLRIGSTRRFSPSRDRAPSRTISHGRRRRVWRAGRYGPARRSVSRGAESARRPDPQGACRRGAGAGRGLRVVAGAAFPRSVHELPPVSARPPIGALASIEDVLRQLGRTGLSPHCLPSRTRDLRARDASTPRRDQPGVQHRDEQLGSTNGGPYFCVRCMAPRGRT